MGGGRGVSVMYVQGSIQQFPPVFFNGGVRELGAERVPDSGPVYTELGAFGLPRVLAVGARGTV